MKEKSFFSNSPEGRHRIVYYDYGKKGDKTILCIHGLARFGRDFEFLAMDLVKHGYRVLAPDIVGRGKSDRFDDYRHYTYDQYIDDMWALLDEEGIEKLDCWLGTSMGGVMGILAATQHPKRIKSLILNDIGPHVPTEAFEYIEKFLAVNEPNDNWDEFYGLFQKRLKTFGIRTDEVMRFLAEISAYTFPDGRVGLNYDANIVHGMFYTYDLRKQAGKKDDLWEEWQQVQCPVFVIRAAESFFFEVDTLMRMKNDNLAMDSVIIADCGHAPALASDEQIVPIRDWLLKHV